MGRPCSMQRQQTSVAKATPRAPGVRPADPPGRSLLATRKRTQDSKACLAAFGSAPQSEAVSPIFTHQLVHVAVPLRVQADEGLALRELKVLQDGVRPDLLPRQQ